MRRSVVVDLVQPVAVIEEVRNAYNGHRRATRDENHRDHPPVLRKKSVRMKCEFVRPSDHTTDIRLGEIIAFEQEWLARRAGQRVGEYVAEIEPGSVTSLAESPVRSSRLGYVLRVDGDNHNVGFADQRIEFAPTRLALACLDDEGS